MKKFITTLFLISALPVFGACHSVSVSGAGSHSGADWNNSLAGIPATLVRGDIYYLADGTYPSYTFSQSGTTSVELRKAQSYDFGSSCGIGAGWNTGTMGSAQAIFATHRQLQIQSTGLIINGNGQQTTPGCGGAVGSNPQLSPATPTDCGIKIDNSTCSSTSAGACTDGISDNGVLSGGFTLQYVEYLGMGNATSESYLIRADSSTGTVLNHMYVHYYGAVSVVAGGTKNFTYSNSYIWRAQPVAGSSPNHGQSIEVGTSTNTGGQSSFVFNNIWRDMSGTAAIATFLATGTSTNWSFYNNVVWNTVGFTPLFPTTDGIIACINSHNCTSMTVVQNSVVGMGNNVNVENEVGGSITVQNNIWYSNNQHPNFCCTGTYTQDHNSFLVSGTGCASGTGNVCDNASANPFTNWPSGNFNLANDAANWNNRTSLGSPYTTDVNGVTFTTDRGTNQFVGGTPTAAAPTCSPIAGSYSSTQSVALSTTSGGAIICENNTGGPITIGGAASCPGGSSLYTTPLSVSTTQTIFSTAGGTGFLDSPLTSCSYTITPPPAISANFNNRTGGAVIPPNSQAANTMSHLDSTSTTLLKNAGISVSREFISLAQVWANCPSPCTADYTSIDGITSSAASRGIKLIISIELTPPDLGASTCTPPTNNTTWATRAAAAIAHVDGLHPGLVIAWEVWNEPDLTGQFCPGAGTNLAAYLPLYTVAAPAMITQVSTDGQSALVGGPALGAPGTNAAAWLANTSTGLLGNTGTKGSVQFVSWHQYIGSCTVDWPTCFSALQNASTGMNALANSINTLVRAGGQPSPSTTPIYVDEYNDSSAFSSDPVRNDATNGPLWNTVFAINSLNQTSPAQINGYYDAASSGTGNFFCLVGNTVAADCSQPPFNPYPQFYALQLLNSINFLGLSTGGNLGTSVTPGSSTSGLQSAAFYTPTSDVILLANPTASPINGQTVTFINSGFSTSAGVQYLLNAANSTITTSAFSGTVNIPANSTVAIILSPGGTKLTAGTKTTSGTAFQ